MYQQKELIHIFNDTFLIERIESTESDLNTIKFNISFMGAQTMTDIKEITIIFKSIKASQMGRNREESPFHETHSGLSHFERLMSYKKAILLCF